MGAISFSRPDGLPLSKKCHLYSFSHLRRLGRRPGHPSNFSDGWTASETEISKKSKTHLGQPSLHFFQPSEDGASVSLQNYG